MRICFYRAQHFDAVDHGQLDIKKDQLWRTVGAVEVPASTENEVKRILAVLYPDQVVGKVTLSQRSYRQFGVGWIIFHQQNINVLERGHLSVLIGKVK